MNQYYKAACKALTHCCTFAQNSQIRNEVPPSYTIKIKYSNAARFKLILRQKIGLQIIPMCNHRAWLKPIYSPTASPTGLTAATPSMLVSTSLTLLA